MYSFNRDIRCKKGFDERTNRWRRCRKSKHALPPIPMPIPVFSTGQGLNAGDPDPNYSVVVSIDPSDFPTPFPAVVIRHSYGVGFDYTASGFITNRANPDGSPLPTNPGAGDFHFQTTFDLTGFDENTATLSLQIQADETVPNILLNGASTGLTAGFTAGFYQPPLTINTGFVSGVNTLVFVVHNSAGLGLMGLRVLISGTAVPV